MIETQVNPVSFKDLENAIFDLINDWIEKYQADNTTKRDTVGLILMRALSCVIATAGSPMEIGDLISDFEEQLAKAVNLVVNEDIDNPIKNIGDK